MVEGQVTPRSAILAAEFVPQEKIEAREGHALLGSYILFQDHDRGDAYGASLASHDLVILGHDHHPVEKGRLDRLLPGPERQRIVGERPEIRVQHQGGIVLQRGRLAHEARPELGFGHAVEHSRLRPCLRPWPAPSGGGPAPAGIDYIWRTDTGKPRYFG